MKQRKRKKNETFYKIAAFVVLLAALFLLVPKEHFFSTLKQEVEKSFYRSFVSFCLPITTEYTKTDGGSMLIDSVQSYFFPIISYAGQVEDYQTEIESTLSYEVILAREAADENYLDPITGELVETASQTAGISQEGATDTATNPSGEETSTGLENEGIGENEVVPAAVLGKQKMVTYSLDKLADFDYLVQTFYQIDNTTTITGSQLNASDMLAKDMKLLQDASAPQILIYHTHSQEGYVDSISGDLSTTVVGVGDYLTQLLTEQYGLNVIHHTGTYDVEDRDHAYAKAGPALEQILAENPSIEVVIDLHRDGVKEGTRLVTNMNGTDMAKIMFFNGLSRTTSTGDIDYLYNPNISDNLAFSFQMQLTAAEYYPDFTRKLYLKGYRYNMHYRPKTLLVEVGAQTNTLQEAKNAMVPLADILNKVLTGSE